MRPRLALTLPVLLGAALACGGSMSSTDDFHAVVDAPALVRKGEPFKATFTVHNSADEVQVLESLDIDDAWLAGVTITASDPAYTDAMHVPLDNTWSYSYGQAIPPGGSIEVTLQAVGTKPGTWRGEVDVCVGGIARFNTYPLVTTVE